MSRNLTERPVLHVAGARPNFPKLAPVMSALAERDLPQVLVHTGQHFDDAMSGTFFRDLGLPAPDVNLGVGGGSHAESTGSMMVGLEREFLDRSPALVVVYGDVNSTVAAALVASKAHIPVAHVEAGLRSRDRGMPEELNRIVTDHLADVLYCTSPDAVENLAQEGVAGAHVQLVGNPMIDTLLRLRDRFDDAWAWRTHGLETYGVVTMHRPSNVDSTGDAAAVVGALHQVADLVPLVMPLHPRGRRTLTDAGLLDNPRIVVTDPLPYLEFMGLVAASDLVVTDSGGIQEETTVLGIPCLTLRDNTERPITITHGTNRLVDRGTLLDAAARALGKRTLEPLVPPLWDGAAGHRIADHIVEWSAAR